MFLSLSWPLQVFTSDHALKLDWIPNWIAIIGSGYIGLEFSDVYTALGSEVTFIEVWCAAPDKAASLRSDPSASSNYNTLSAELCKMSRAV